MRSVDHMIKYLSGDLTREETRAFEQELAGDKELRHTFDRVEAAYRLTESQLRKKDEEEFRARLREIMDHSPAGRTMAGKRRRPPWLLLLPVAASLAVLLAILLMNRSPEKVFSAFYHPAEDQVLLAYQQETRGKAESAITLYSQGLYRASLEETSGILLQDPGNHLAILFHLLAAMELDMEEDVIPLVKAAQINCTHVLGQSITWYQVLALVKTGCGDEAAEMLHALTEQPGPYREDAYKLKKILLK
jgi:hypothetical protein